jgi:hypothetical protein
MSFDEKSIFLILTKHLLTKRRLTNRRGTNETLQKGSNILQSKPWARNKKAINVHGNRQYGH